MNKTSRYDLWCACIGNLFEHYDTALFGFLSPFLAPLIFPEHDHVTALILTYAIIPLGMLARPIGALVLGHIGDTYGRKRALFLSLAGMSIVSGVIAFSPTYLQASLLAPIIFCAGRILQNFLAAGETMGGAIYLLENSKERNQDLLSSLYSCTTMAGHLLASFGVFIISHYAIVEPGWRYLYLCGCLTGFFGCMLRRSYEEIPVRAKSSGVASNIIGSLWRYRKELILIIICSGFAHANYSMALVLMNGLVPMVSTVSKAQIMEINTYLLIFDLCALPFFGWVSSKISRKKLMLIISLMVFVLSTPLIINLQQASLITIVGVRVVFVIFGVAFFAPFHAWTQQLIPTDCRYVVISFGYAIGSQLLGSPTAAFALWCYQKSGMIESVCWYWMAIALLSSISIGATIVFDRQLNQKICY